MSFIDRLEDIFKDEGIACGDPFYLLDEIKAKAIKLIEIDGNHWLALDTTHPWDEKDPQNLHDCSLDFALFSFGMSEVDGKNTRVHLVFEGSGPTANLKEFRHTYWGPTREGYVFYLPIKATIKALEILSEYFED